MKAALSDGEFERLRALLHDAAGLVFDETRRDSLAYAVGERLPASGCADVGGYLDLVAGSAGHAERQALLDEVTIPETYFLRNPPQIRALRQQVLPELVAAAAATQRLVVWSAGCSTGEEPYTLAIMLHELVPDIARWDVRIVATDVSQRALAAARRGRYGRRAVQLVDAETVGRWFDVEDGDYVVRPELRRLVQFRHHNLVTDPPPFLSGEVDLVLCRNVTIYFDRPTTRTLVRGFHRSLRDGGYLFLGHAETLWQVTDDFRLVTIGDAFVYRRLAPPKPTVSAVPRQVDGAALRGARRLLGTTGATGTDERRPGTAPVPLAPSPGAAPGATLEGVSAELRAGRYAEAAALAGEVARRRPLLAEAHYLRGMALCNLGRDREALTALRKAVYLDADAGFAHFLLAGALARLGERVAAARAYRAAADTLGRRPGDAMAAELGGRSLTELISLCRTLAGSEERKASAGGSR